jgi:hypothetical protein
VTKGGKVVRCSDCIKLREEYAEELNTDPKLRERLDQIEAMDNVADKAKAAADLNTELSNVRANNHSAAEEIVDASKGSTQANLSAGHSVEPVSGTATANGWPPPQPVPPKPRVGDPGAAEWRYKRYVFEKWRKGVSPENIRTFEEWAPFNEAAEKGLRPGRSGGEQQVAAKRQLTAEEGILQVENIELVDCNRDLSGRYP